MTDLFRVSLGRTTGHTFAWVARAEGARCHARTHMRAQGRAGSRCSGVPHVRRSWVSTSSQKRHQQHSHATKNSQPRIDDWVQHRGPTLRCVRKKTDSSRTNETSKHGTNSWRPTLRVRKLIERYLAVCLNRDSAILPCRSIAAAAPLDNDRRRPSQTFVA